MAESREADGVFELLKGAQGAEKLSAAAIERAKGLPIWSAKVEPAVLSGGLSNINLTVEDAGRRYVIRVGADEPHLGVFRENEVKAYRAAHAAGVAPEVIYDEPGLIVMRFIEGKALLPAELREPDRLRQAARLLRQLHREAHKHLESPGFMFWSAQHNRWYIRLLNERLEQVDARWRALLPEMATANEALEATIGEVRMVFSHGDTLPQNFIDDGTRLWLVDWEYAGFNMDLFDLAGLGMNIECVAAEVDLLLESYGEAPVTDALRRRFAAAKILACIRESTWSFLAEVTTRPIDFDYSVYSAMNAERYRRMYAEYKAM